MASNDIDRIPGRARLRHALVVLLALWPLACAGGGPAGTPPALRLVDLFDLEGTDVVGTPDNSSPPPRRVAIRRPAAR